MGTMTVRPLGRMKERMFRAISDMCTFLTQPQRCCQLKSRQSVVCGAAAGEPPARALCGFRSVRQFPDINILEGEFVPVILEFDLFGARERFRRLPEVF